MYHDAIRKGLALCLFLAAGLALSGCRDCLSVPDPGGTSDVDALDTEDADVFVPLALERIVPSSGSTDGGDRIAIYGAGFQQGAKVFFDELPCTTLLVLDKGRINCNAPAHVPGLVDVRVHLLDGQEKILREVYLYRGALAIEAIEPTIARASGNIPVTVTGGGFDPETRVLVGGRMLRDRELVDETTIRGLLPARLQGRDGPVDVIVSNGLEQRTLKRGLRYIDDLTVDWLSPNAGPSAGGGLLSLYGAGLAPETFVKVGGMATEVAVTGRGGVMTVRVPPGAPGAVDVVIENPVETLVLPGAYHYLDEVLAEDELRLVGAWPPLGDVRGGDQVVLAVQGLPTLAPAKSLEVTFDGEAARVMDVRPYENLIVVVVPPGTAGDAVVEVRSSSRSAERGDIFAYTDALEARVVQPTTGSTTGGEELSILGSGFGPDTRVWIGGAPADAVSAPTDDQLEATLPPGVPGLVDVVIRDGERIHRLFAGFEYRHPGDPRLWAVAPEEGSRAGGRIVRLHGEGLTQLTDLNAFFGDDERPGELRDDASVIVRAPRGDVGSVNVSLAEAGRIAMGYTFFDPGSTYGGTANGPIPEALNVTVLETVTHEPVEEAYVILWDDIDGPYQGLTDDRGQITFSDDRFAAPQMVTASKDSYTTSSVVDFDARDVTLFITNLEPAEPGGGGGGGETPQPVPDSVVAGAVTGIDKYVIPEPSRCENKDLTGLGTLCSPCVTDDDCEGEGARCIALKGQGTRCATACEDASDCPVGFACVGVGFGEIQCIPEPGKKTAYCSTTSEDIFTDDLGGALPAFIDDTGTYRLDTPPGERAIVCLGGFEDPDTGEFIPVKMGVRRHVFALPDELVGQQDVALDIPLDRTLHIRLDDPPQPDSGQPIRNEVDVFIDLGSDGVFKMPMRGVGEDQRTFALERYPARFAESLYDASYTIYSGAYEGVDDVLDDLFAPDPLRPDSSFVVLRDVVQLDEDTAFRIFDDGVEHTKTGITSPINQMVGGEGGEVLWAAGDGGRVLHFDGTWWGLQQTPTSHDLRGIWARADDDVWAVGDGGVLVRFDGLTWERRTLPPALADVDWWAITGAGSAIWLAGPEGVFRLTDAGYELMLPPGLGREQVVRAMWSGEPDSVWLFGERGLIRHWTPVGFEVMDPGGADLLAASGTVDNDIWAVGEQGRVLRWNGDVWFDFLPITRRTLRAVHAPAPDSAWIAGDAGTVIRYDGERIALLSAVEHSDLFGIRELADGRVYAGGRHAIIVGPFLRIPRPVNPNSGGTMISSVLEWHTSGGADASINYVDLLTETGGAFWDFMVNGERSEIPLPDLLAAWGLYSLWPVDGSMRVIRIYQPGATIDRFDYTFLSPYVWRSWSIGTFPATFPETMP